MGHGKEPDSGPSVSWKTDQGIREGERHTKRKAETRVEGGELTKKEVKIAA